METSKERSSLGTIILLFLFFITVWYFAYWGYQWVKYLLGFILLVDTESTIFDLFIGLIAMGAGVSVFVGATKAWRMMNNYYNYFLFGATGFVIKNILEIVNVVYKLYPERGMLSSSELGQAAMNIGNEMLQIAFWVFVFIYFTKHFYKIKASVENKEKAPEPIQD